MAALVRILGPRPWFTLTFDTETTKDARLRLRVGYYEVRGISFTRAVTRYREGRLTPDDRHRLIEAAFILPPVHQFPTDADTVRAYAHEHSRRDGYKDIPSAHRSGIRRPILLLDQGHRRLGRRAQCLLRSDALPDQLRAGVESVSRRLLAEALRLRAQALCAASPHSLQIAGTLQGALRLLDDDLAQCPRRHAQNFSTEIAHC